MVCVPAGEQMMIKPFLCGQAGFSVACLNSFWLMTCFPEQVWFWFLCGVTVGLVGRTMEAVAPA